MPVDVRSEKLTKLVDENVEVEQLGTGFTFTEGPIWHPRDEYLLFSDMPADIRRKWTPDGTVVEVMNPSNKCNGMTYDADLNLLVCEHSTSSVVRERPDGTRETLATHYQGKELNSPNDIVVHSSGAIYFTDPTYGRWPGFGVEREQDLDFQGVYRLAPGGGDPELLVDDFGEPNGLCFSPDESLLYINDTPNALIRVFDVQARRVDRERAAVREGHRRRRPREGRARRRDEVPTSTATSGSRAPAASGCSRRTASTSASSRSPRASATSTGAARTGTGCSCRPRRRSTASRRRSPDGASRSCARRERMADFTLDPKRTALIVQDMQNDVIIEGGAFAESGSPRAREGAERRRELGEARGRVPREGRARHPRPLHRRGGRAGPEAERAALPGA